MSSFPPLLKWPVLADIISFCLVAKEKDENCHYFYCQSAIFNLFRCCRQNKKEKVYFCCESCSIFLSFSFDWDVWGRWSFVGRTRFEKVPNLKIVFCLMNTFEEGCCLSNVDRNKETKISKYHLHVFNEIVLRFSNYEKYEMKTKQN